MSMCVSIAQARAKSAPQGSQALGLRHFPASPFLMILWDSLKGPGMKILLKVFYNSQRSSWRDCTKMLSEAFAWSCTGTCEKLEALEEVLVTSSRCPYIISCRSLWAGLVEILLTSSRGPCIKILKILCICVCMTVLLVLKGNSCMKILWAPLYRSIRSCCCSCGHV